MCRLNQTWEVSNRLLSKWFISQLKVNIQPLFFPQKLPSKFKKFYGEFESLMVSWTQLILPFKVTHFISVAAFSIKHPALPAGQMRVLAALPSAVNVIDAINKAIADFRAE